MTFREIAETYNDEVRATQIMRLNYLNSNDIDVCKYVINQLPRYVNMKNIEYGSSISLDELIESSLNEIKIFGDDFSLIIKNLLSRIIINRQDDLFAFSTYVVYSLDENDNICFDSGRIDSYKISKELFELSVFDFSHEHIHALKETNYQEYINSFVLGETLPIFYELMIYNSDDVLKKQLIKSRLYSLTNDKKVFLTTDKLINLSSDISDNLLFEHIRSKFGSYLNSFYYAVILYQMYKESPKKILDLVSRVLKHEMTTLEMLEQLGIYGDIRGEVFEKELGTIKKLIR